MTMNAMAMDPIIGTLQTSGQPGQLEAYIQSKYGTGSQSYNQYQQTGIGGNGSTGGNYDVQNPMSGLDKFNMGLDIFKTGLGAYTALESQKLASDQFDFTKQAYATNLANQSTAMNKAVADDYNRGNAWKPGSLGSEADHMAKWGAVT